MEESTHALLDEEFLKQVNTAVTQYLVPMVVAVFAAIFQLVTAFKSTIGNKTVQEAEARADIPGESHADVLIKELKRQNARHSRSQNFMLLLIVVVAIGVSYLFLNESGKGKAIISALSEVDNERSNLEEDLSKIIEVNELMGIVSLESLDEDDSKFFVSFDKSCSREYLCFSNEYAEFKTIENHLTTGMRERNMLPVLYLTGFATQNADVIYNSKVSMERALKVYQKLVKKFVVGGINITELSDSPDERGNTTKVRVSIAWYPNRQVVDNSEVLNNSEREEARTRATSRPNPESIPSNSVSNVPVVIEDMYTTLQANEGEDTKVDAFVNGQRVYVRFRAKVETSQEVRLVWKDAEGKVIRDRQLSLNYSTHSYRMHDYKSVFPSTGSYEAQLLDLNDQVLGSTKFVVE